MCSLKQSKTATQVLKYDLNHSHIQKHFIDIFNFSPLFHLKNLPYQIILSNKAINYLKEKCRKKPIQIESSKFTKYYLFIMLNVT
jgi:hypothetical protein